MRVRRLWLLSILCVGAAVAQTPDAAAPPATSPAVPDDAAAHDALRALQAAMETAINNRDLEGVLAHCDDAIVFTAMNGEVAHGKDEIRQYFRRMMEGPDKILESITTDFVPDNLSTLLGAGQDVAVAVGNADDRYVLASGKAFDIDARWSATLVKRDGRWLVASFHYSTNVFRNPILELQRKYLLWAGAGSALLLGGIGFLVGRRRAPRPA